MKNKKLLLSRVLALTIIASVLISCFALSSFADTSVPEASTDGYSVDIQAGYYLLQPNANLIKNYPLAQSYQFDFFVGENYSVYMNSVVSLAMVPDNDYTDIYFGKQTDVFDDSYRVCRVFEDSSISWFKEEYKLLFVPAQTVNSNVLNFLGISCIKGVAPGWYEFNYTSPLLGSFEFNLPFFTPNSPQYQTLPSVVYGRIEDSLQVFGEYSNTPTLVLYFDEISSQGRRFSTSGGFTSDLPGTVIWNGKFYFENPQYFSSAQQYYWFTVLFTPAWYLSDPNADYDKGYDDGYDYGFDVGKGAGLAQGFQEGKDTWYPIGLEEGEDIGYEKGYNASGTENFGKNRLDSTLSAPWNALMNFKLFNLPGGTPFTFGTLVATGMSIALLIVFLKMFAGG